MRRILMPFKPLLGDYLILLLSASAILWLLIFKLPQKAQADALMVKITSPQGDYIYPLNQDKILELGDGVRLSVIEIAANRVRMQEDNSPQQIAVNRGWISKPGQWIVNLPHKISISVIGREAVFDSEVY